MFFQPAFSPTAERMGSLPRKAQRWFGAAFTEGSTKFQNCWGYHLGFFGERVGIGSVRSSKRTSESGPLSTSARPLGRLGVANKQKSKATACLCPGNPRVHSDIPCLAPARQEMCEMCQVARVQTYFRDWAELGFIPSGSELESFHGADGFCFLFLFLSRGPSHSSPSFWTLVAFWEDHYTLGPPVVPFCPLFFGN